jgi:uncharacterized protein (DUF427 family)
VPDAALQYGFEGRLIGVVMDCNEALSVTDEVRRRRDQWVYRGESRPSFAIAPTADQESVWDYPRPPRVVRDFRHVVVSFEGRVLAESTRAFRVLETAGAPTFYLPPADVRLDRFAESDTRSSCEWKGVGVGLDLIEGPREVAWSYPRTFPEFGEIEGWIGFYPGRVDCSLAGERVRPQPGGYYGGWITDEIVGPFKGEDVADGL